MKRTEQAGEQAQVFGNDEKDQARDQCSGDAGVGHARPPHNLEKDRVHGNESSQDDRHRPRP